MATARKAVPKTADTNWRAETLARVRALITEADPEITEDRKWKKPSNPAGVPTFERDGILLTGETYKDKVKLTFAHGAALPDPAKLFNASLDAGTRRAIDIPEGATLNEKAFKALIKAAVAFNAAKAKPKKTPAKKKMICHSERARTPCPAHADEGRDPGTTRQRVLA